ncbi:3'-phosphoadenosine 5'-phosphosulfate sulfotransferase [Entomophthora muscae]|uniref:3'-phosphoadenosine 5'-phosphosulfate sulfotransferase n=2 Tax=Entomophthora muscae TaxID=34485 RepID=A0ACC2SER8_9FUNG|nr:3'-phosphoadenosine 5'-phosphosulfate sulfotransferase [Entomophthora muscae]
MMLGNLGNCQPQEMKENTLNLDKVYDLAQSDHPISSQVKFSLEIIERALKEYGIQAVALSFNGGKDCTVLLHLFSAVQKRMSLQENGNAASVKAPSIYIETPNPFDEIETFVSASANLYQLELFKAEGPMKVGLAHFLSKKPEIKAVLIGTRRTDPHGGSLTTFIPTSDDWPEAMRVHPILDWEYKTVWAFLRALDVPYCSLYDHGYTSLGDRDNTLPNPLLKNDRLACGYDPAWMLEDNTSERKGRIQKT